MTPFTAAHIQLGIIPLELDLNVVPPCPPTSAKPAQWSELPLDFLEGNPDFFLPNSIPALEVLIDAFHLGIIGEWTRIERFVLVRVGLLPMDAKGGSVGNGKGKGRETTVIKDLLQLIVQEWNTEHGKRLMARAAVDGKSVHDLYASVPSPCEPVQPSVGMSPQDQEMWASLEQYENPKGVKTDLYQYQVRSVAKMIQMENHPEKMIDPCWTKFEEAGRNGNYYVNIETWEIQRNPGWYDLPRGGILCEQMGTGKTLMCLSLICATLHQPTLPPTDLINIQITPVSTNVAERTYPFNKYHSLRTISKLPKSKTKLALPSLVDLCANVLSSHDPTLSIHIPHLDEKLRRQMFYCHLPENDECKREVKDDGSQKKPKKVYLTKTTLVVVPPILVQQWKKEIETHLEDNVLRVYEATTEELPSIDELMQYDVVLMDVNRFSAEEAQHRELQKLKQSVLLQGRWKRVILDEGHVAKTKRTNAMSLACALSIERRWLVTGTPTRHLQQGGEIELNATELDHTQDLINRRIWSQSDIEDVTRLGVMIGEFLGAEPFKSKENKTNFQNLVTNPLRGSQGPAYGAVQRIKGIMDAFLVKHGVGVIDGESQLPPITITKELLQFDPMQRITYNVIVAVVSSNVLQSEGEDVDYLLHHRNIESFNQVVSNFHLACFWFSAPDMDTSGCIKRTRHWLENHPEASMDIRERLEEGCRHLQVALNTPGWEEWMTNGLSMPLDIQNQDNSSWSSNSLIKESWSDSFNTLPDLIDVHSLNELRKKNVPGKSIQELHIEGWDHRAHRSEWFMEELERSEKRHGISERKRLEKVKDDNHKKAIKAAHAPRAATALTIKTPSKVQKKRSRSKSDVDERLDEAARNAASQNATTLESLVNDDSQSGLPHPLSSILRTKTKSAKVNFVLSTIIDSDPKDKFIIFGDNYELGHLTEALDLLDITSCHLGTKRTLEERKIALKEFESPDVRVCLLDLNLGARGLNLIMANRVIFLAPVWNLDVQAQAIKRVHRIGQKKETRVQILVTEGTFEEDIARRSSSIHSRSKQIGLGKEGEEEKLYSRAMIENPKFVYHEKEEQRLFKVRFTPVSEGSTSSPVLPSSGTSTPVDNLPTTPTTTSTRNTEPAVRFAGSSSASHVEFIDQNDEPLIMDRDMNMEMDRHIDQGGVEDDFMTGKRKNESDGGKGKKKTRVTFI